MGGTRGTACLRNHQNYSEEPSGLLTSKAMYNTSLAAPGALAHRLQNPKWPPGCPKMANGVWKGVYPEVFGRSKQLSLNKFFDPSTPSMGKGNSEGKERRKN